MEHFYANKIILAMNNSALKKANKQKYSNLTLEYFDKNKLSYDNKSYENKSLHFSIGSITLDQYDNQIILENIYFFKSEDGQEKFSLPQEDDFTRWLQEEFDNKGLILFDNK